MNPKGLICLVYIQCVTNIECRPWIFYMCSHTCSVCVCVCIQSLRHVSLIVTPWTIAHQALLSMQFSTQEYWNELPFPTPRDIPGPGIEPASLPSPTLAGSFLATASLGKPNTCVLLALFVQHVTWITNLHVLKAYVSSILLVFFPSIAKLHFLKQFSICSWQEPPELCRAFG